jgi:hypothetical protein
MKITKIILWGHKLHSHTHSYIHNAYFIAFKHLGFDTFWFDDKDDVSKFDFSNSLFITEHQVDNHIPKKNDCLYFVHYSGIIFPGKYDMLEPENIIVLKVAFRDMKRDNQSLKNFKPIPLNEKNYEYYFKDDKHYKYYTMWGTDLLPDQIQNNIDNIDTISKKINSDIYYFCGSLQGHNTYINYLKSKNIKFEIFGGTFNKHHPNNLSIEENIDLIQKSIIAPAFQFGIQLEDHYIPCRIFKNISYGRMGITNNPIVNSLFNNQLIYDSNINNCIDMGIEFEKKNNKLEIIKRLMYKVKEDHTYISRIESMKYFINNFTKFSI